MHTICYLGFYIHMHLDRREVTIQTPGPDWQLIKRPSLDAAKRTIREVLAPSHATIGA